MTQNVSFGSGANTVERSRKPSRNVISLLRELAYGDSSHPTNENVRQAASLLRRPTCSNNSSAQSTERRFAFDESSARLRQSSTPHVSN
jgi:hypothetical protein